MTGPGEINMADPKTEEKAAAEAATKEAADKAAAEKAASSDGEDKTGLRAALAKQAGEKDAAYAALEKKLHARDAADLKAKEDKLKADGELQELLDARELTIKEMTDKSTAAVRSLLESSAREKLRDLGMARPLSLAGAVAGLPADATAETLDAWAAQMKVANESEFVKGVKPLNMGGAGDPKADATDGSLEERLKSDDKEVRAAANAERLKKKMTGEL